MSAYEEFRPTRDYARLNPSEEDPATYGYAIRGEPGCVNLWLMAGEEVHYSETYRGPSAHVRALHAAHAWLEFSRGLALPEWEPDATRIRGPA